MWWVSCIVVWCCCLAHAQHFPKGSLQGHLTLAELNHWVSFLLSTYPQFCAQKQIGLSVQGRPINLFCLGNACISPRLRLLESPQPQSHEILYTALHHAREPLGMMALVAFVDDIFFQLQANNLTVRHLLTTRSLHFVFVVNPDGYAYNEITSDNMRRKNLGNYCPGKDGGVDLNRNYALCFDQDQTGGSNKPCEIDFQGPFAFSEPETQAIRDLVLGQSYRTAFNFHSFGKQIYLPYSCRPLGQTVDNNFFFTYAKRLSRKNHYQFGQPWNSGLYSVNGDASDWMYATRNIYAVSPEVAPADPVSSEQAGFWVLPTLVQELAKETLDMNYVGAWTAGSMLELNWENDQVLVYNYGLQNATKLEWALNHQVKELEGLLLCKGESFLPLLSNLSVVVGDRLVVAVRSEYECVVYEIEPSTSLVLLHRISPRDAPCLDLFSIPAVTTMQPSPVLIHDDDERETIVSPAPSSWRGYLVVFLCGLVICRVVYILYYSCLGGSRSNQVKFRPLENLEEV